MAIKRSAASYLEIFYKSLFYSGLHWRIYSAPISYCMIGLCHLMAGDDSRMTGDCCRPEGSIHRCIRTHSYLYSHIYMAL